MVTNLSQYTHSMGQDTIMGQDCCVMRTSLPSHIAADVCLAPGADVVYGCHPRPLCADDVSDINFDLAGVMP